MTDPPGPWASFVPSLIATFVGVVGALGAGFLVQRSAATQERRQALRDSQDALAELRDWLTDAVPQLHRISTAMESRELSIGPVADHGLWRALSPHILRTTLAADERTKLNRLALDVALINHAHEALEGIMYGAGQASAETEAMLRRYIARKTKGAAESAAEVLTNVQAARAGNKV